MKIVFTGGGTGGHIFPIVSIVQKIKKIFPNEDLKNLEMFFLGPKDPFYSQILRKEGIQAKEISAGKIRRYFSIIDFLRNIRDLFFKIPIGIIQSYFVLKRIRPDLIFSKGGYGGLPTVIAGYKLKIPIFLHESDVTPGLANKLSFKYAKKIFTAFPKEDLENIHRGKMIFAGNPIREEILKGNKEFAEKLFNLTGEKPVLLILGGSQGAQRINDVIIECLKEILELFEVIHQCGAKNYKELFEQTSVIFEGDKNLKKFYHLYDFLGENLLKHAYKTSDLVISRAGAGVISEILAVGIPSILVPLPESAQNHQAKNAYAVKNYGAAIVIEESNLKPHFLVEKLKFLFSKPRTLKEMAEKTKHLNRPDSEKIIIDNILEVLRNK